MVDDSNEPSESATRPMNPYGHLAWEHWDFVDPERVAEMALPYTFFADLGLRVMARVSVEMKFLLAQQLPAPDLGDRIEQVQSARFNAEITAMMELAWITGPYDDDVDVDLEALLRALRSLDQGEDQWLAEVLGEFDPATGMFEERRAMLFAATAWQSSFGLEDPLVDVVRARLADPRPSVMVDDDMREFLRREVGRPAADAWDLIAERDGS